MDISVHPLDPAKRRAKPKDEKNLVFGRVFSDHMFMMDFTKGKGWQDPRIVPYISWRWTRPQWCSITDKGYSKA